jgi:hypothetical protein
MLETPVVIIAFNRPDKTQQLITALAKTAPPKVYTVIDGPRCESDINKCNKVRKLLQNLPWNCQSQPIVSESNLGCRRRVISGLDIVFEQEDSAIILEDDCLPDPSFFPFCQTLLQYYLNDQRVMHIGGNNFQQGILRGDASYYFSRHTHCWGWATWKRAWQSIDRTMEHWQTFKDLDGMADWSTDELEKEFYMKELQKCYDGEIDSWAYIWGYSCLLNHAFGIVPQRNLVSNSGFGEDATHTTIDQWYSNLATDSIGSIRHPEFIIRNREADQFYFDKVIGGEEMRYNKTFSAKLKRLPKGIRRRLGR